MGCTCWALQVRFCCLKHLVEPVEKPKNLFRRIEKAAMRNKNAAPKNTADAAANSQDQYCYEGERLTSFLKRIHGELQSSKLQERHSLPRKFWIKQYFAIGVNEVTRALERMPSADKIGGSTQKLPQIVSTHGRKPPQVQLQAILIAADCNPKWLTKHMPSLASSRKVPVISVKDKKGGSRRLGELVQLKTAMAIGVKEKGHSINQVVEEILRCNNETNLETESLKFG